MKARVKATGEIVNVISIWDSSKSYYERLDVCDTKPIRYSVDELDFSDILGEAYEPPEHTYTPDYWTRLEHQAAIAAMQGLVLTASKHMGTDQEVAQWACEYAHALVEKMKEEKK